MIDPKKPNNKLAKLPADFDCDQVDILKLANKANLALSNLNGQTSATASNFKNAMFLAETFSIPEAVASSAVENVITTVNEALQSRALPESELTPEQKETGKYSVATSVGFKLLSDKKHLATNDYLRIQKELDLPQTGIRNIPGYVIADKITKEIYYTPPEGEALVRTLLKNFEEYFNDRADDPDPLIKMAILHYQFEAIHPFPDGNGRTGRILMPLYLVARGRLVLPVLFLSEYILNNRSEYYRLLRGVTYNNEWKPWIVYILNGVIAQANKTSMALVQIIETKKAFQVKIPDRIPVFRRTDLLDFLFTTAVFSRDQLAKQLNVHVNTASSYLNTLTKTGLIKVFKRKNSKIFYVPGFIKILNQ